MYIYILPHFSFYAFLLLDITFYSFIVVRLSSIVRSQTTVAPSTQSTILQFTRIVPIIKLRF